MIDCIVDISHYQKGIDTTELRGKGILAVISKATQGLSGVDETFFENIQKCVADGMYTGFYHFGINGNGKQQAEHFLNTIAGLNGIMVLDWEWFKGAVMQPSDVNHFIKTIFEKTGRYPVLYTNYYFLQSQKILDWKYLRACPLWIAEYTKVPHLPKQWSSWAMWQYTGGAKMVMYDNARSGIIDRDYFNGGVDEMVKFWNANSLG